MAPQSSLLMPFSGGIDPVVHLYSLTESIIVSTSIYTDSTSTSVQVAALLLWHELSLTLPFTQSIPSYVRMLMGL